TNQNVTRQAAISLKGISVSGKLADILKQKIKELILKKSLSDNTRGELLLSYQQLFKLKFEDILKSYKDVVDPEFIYRAASANTESEFAFNYLSEKFDSFEGKAKNDVISAIINFKNFSTKLKYRNIIFSSLDSNSPVLISMAIYGIDSTFIENHKSELEKSLSSVVPRYMNDPNFYESIQAIADLSMQLDNNFNLDILKKLQHSEVYALRKYADEKLDVESDILNQDSKLFNELWSNSFKYKYAEVVTEKGKFRITFTPGFAPISTGNFCYLASKHFFDGIIFHRVVPAFVIQGGDPTGTGWGGPEYSIVSEFSPLHYSISAVGMASAGKDTEGSQWFVTTGDYPHLDGRYTIFGYATDGMNVVNKIDQNDKILSVKLFY
ncbi:MAG: peptidylprolyl isomerase, partial [Ignavibacteriaceae bacterium]